MQTASKKYHEWFANAVWKKVRNQNDDILSIKDSRVVALGVASELAQDCRKQIYEVTTINWTLNPDRSSEMDYKFAGETKYRMDLEVLVDFIRAD